MIKIYEVGKIKEEEIFARNEPVSEVGGIVREIIDNVKTKGDRALGKYLEKFDGVKLSQFKVSREEIEEAIGEVETEFLDILKEAESNIRAFHEKQVRQGFMMTNKSGVILGQRVVPIEKVGIYVPGGTAAYPSTVLMDAVPAKIAGVSEIIMVTPPNKEGRVNPYILAAAKIAGVTSVYKIGGAQAVAALAFGQVGIDMIAGPSEVLVLADGKSNPKFVAADLLSQAEHDKNASCVLITESYTLAEKVREEIENQLKMLEREEIARASVENNGKIIICKDLLQGIEIANRIAPEHMEVCVDEPFNYLGLIKNAGSVFLGRYNAEPTGDYFAGPNHTLPTSGTARFYSPLSVEDFVKNIQYSYYTKEALREDYEKISYFAKKEGLTAHARAVDIRFEEE